ncbi:MAG: hypothetical protein K2R98_18245 [Gemmataceae bacterium]|nr:hypothetical protein [Gemmataceae bacterium]
MLQTAIVRAPVTSDNWEDFVSTIKARDQRRELRVGDVISHFYDEDFDSQEIEVMILHNHRRAAVCYYDGDSEWGDWDELEQVIVLDDPDLWGRKVRLDRYGHPVVFE